MSDRSGGMSGCRRKIEHVFEPHSFAHLNVRTYFSMKDGAFSPEDLAWRAADQGMAAVAITDRDGLYGAARFAAACRRHGVRPIYGATLTVRTLPHAGAPPVDR